MTIVAAQIPVRLQFRETSCPVKHAGPIERMGGWVGNQPERAAGCWPARCPATY
jgi:hypothetical protein